eukprot:4838396-Pyramimonas_sp.AAC.1
MRKRRRESRRAQGWGLREEPWGPGPQEECQGAGAKGCSIWVWGQACQPAAQGAGARAMRVPKKAKRLA